MSDNEMAIVVLSIIFGSIVAIVAISKVFGLIKAWIERNNSSYDEESFDRLAKAFIKHKKDSERRFQNLEAIVTEDEPKSSSSSSKKQLKEAQLHNTIEIDSDEDQKEEQKEQRESKSSNSGNLRNMLKE